MESSEIKIAIIQFPGSHGMQDIAVTIERTGMLPVDFLSTDNPALLADMQAYVIAGGSSYEDKPRPGLTAALHPLMQQLKQENELGKPILGIGNGAQILLEAGLVPGLENNKPAMVFTGNDLPANGSYHSVYLRLSPEYQRNAFTRHLSPDLVLCLPLANLDSQLIVAPALLAEIEANGLNVFHYCNEIGDLQSNVIAAISNKAGNVMAIMAHPEAVIDGDKLFNSMRDYILQDHYIPVMPLHYYPRQPK